MNERKLRQLNILALIVVIVSIFFVMLFAFAFSPNDGKRIEAGQLEKFNNNWVLKNYKGEKDRIVKLPLSLDADKDDTIVLMNEVPEDVRPDSVLLFETKFQNIMVMVEDTKVYSNGVLNSQKLMKNAVPCYNVIPIGFANPKDVISIYMSSAYDKYSGEVCSVYYGTKSDVYAMFVKKYGVGFILSVVLLVITIILAIWLITMKNVNVNRRRAGYAFGFVFNVALWSLVNNPIMQLMTGNNFGIYMMGMILLLLMPVLYLMYQRCLPLNKRFARIFEIGMYVFAINLLTGVVFQLLSVCDFAYYIIFTKILITLVLILLTTIMYIAAESTNDSTIQNNFIANAVLTGTCIIEAILSLFRFYEPLDGLVLQIGIYVFVVLFVVSTEKRVIDEMSAQRDKALDSIQKEKNTMLGQLNVNLVYNSLNKVIGNLKSKDMEDSRLVYDASIYLKHNMNTLSGKEMVPFSEELEYIRAYLGIQRQLSEGLEVSIEDKIIDFMVPFNTIEPLVENAVVNGALKAGGSGRIVIRSYERLDCFAIQIVDNGKGLGPDKKFTGKQTFKSIRKRLKSSCGAAIDINNKPDKGTIITVKLPKEGYIIKE